MVDNYGRDRYNSIAKSQVEWPFKRHQRTEGGK